MRWLQSHNRRLELCFSLILLNEQREAKHCRKRKRKTQQQQRYSPPNTLLLLSKMEPGSSPMPGISAKSDIDMSATSTARQKELSLSAKVKARGGSGTPVQKMGTKPRWQGGPLPLPPSELSRERRVKPHKYFHASGPNPAEPEGVKCSRMLLFHP